ncbi:MAG: hypothetical protein INR71_09980, partial [Terriglobus roseus]|nr:hypothetical protein [Terriglobus roseus]
MELSRTEYPALLVKCPAVRGLGRIPLTSRQEALQPTQAVEMLNERMRHVGKLNGEVADWLQVCLARRASGGSLRRTGTKTRGRGVRVGHAEAGAKATAGLKFRDGVWPDTHHTHCVATSAGLRLTSGPSIFTAPWQKLVDSAETIAESHHLLAAKIEVDIERPLRNFASQNRDAQAMSTISGNLAAMAKEIDSAQKKAEKLQSKGGKAATDKVAGAASEVESAIAQWESQAPYVFEKLQAVDESRLNNLRDLLTQFQTHEVDQVERSRITAEDCLNSLLTIETADEIKTFQLKTLQGRPRLAAEKRERRRTLPGSSAAPSEDVAPPLPTPRAQDDNALSQTLSPPSAAPDASSERSPSADRERKRSSGFGGLKRLGTVIGRTPKKDK